MEKYSLYIIGGSGFIGKNMVRCFYNQYDITVVDKFIDRDYFAAYPDVRTVELNLVDSLIPADYATPDFIINLASVVTAERDLQLFDELIQSNLKVMLNLYIRFKDESRLKLFIQFGSSEEYGAEGSPFAETMREQPITPYSLVKQLTSNTALMLHRNFGFPALVVRPSNLFGPQQHVSKFIPYVIDTLRRNQPLNVTPCEQKRDFIYVDDFAKAIKSLIANYPKAVGEIINVSTGNSVALKAIIEYCKEKLHSYSVVNYGFMPYRVNEVVDLKSDITKFKVITNTVVETKIYERLDELIHLLSI